MGNNKNIPLIKLAMLIITKDKKECNMMSQLSFNYDPTKVAFHYYLKKKKKRRQ